MAEVVLLTGAAGGIGRVLQQELGKDFRVIGVDRRPVSSGDIHIEFDCASLAEDAGQRELRNIVADAMQPGDRFKAVINNAAVQILGSTEDIQLADFQQSMFVNVTVPFIISQMFIKDLEDNHGVVLNIGSIHASMTKPGFVAYATSKAALAGLTRALAVDLGGRVRVNCIAPAAISTPMLEAGFKNNPDGLASLNAFHPSGRIGQPAEIADLARFLLADDVGFLNGSSISIDGAISARLHDPS